MKADTILRARNLMQARHFGILGTISVKLEGFPFGSVVPYCLDGEGRPVVLISTIAQHTINVAQDNRCSLTIVQEVADVQANGRICVIGHLEKLAPDAEAVRERYFRHFPAARKYGQAHSFSFYYLAPVSVRYIGGFGAIHWLTPADFFCKNPFHGKGEQRIVEHMNADHRDNLLRYLAHFKGMNVDADADVRMVGMDENGFDVFVGKAKVRFEFDAPVQTAAAAREVLVEMARVAG